MLKSIEYILKLAYLLDGSSVCLLIAQCIFSCLADGKTGNSRFLPRYHSSAILLYLQSFKFALGEEVSGPQVLGMTGLFSYCSS